VGKGKNSVGTFLDGTTAVGVDSATSLGADVGAGELVDGAVCVRVETPHASVARIKTDTASCLANEGVVCMTSGYYSDVMKSTQNLIVS